MKGLLSALCCVLFPLLLVVGCSSTSGPDDSDDHVDAQIGDYFPLDLGMRWSYEFYRRDGAPYHDEDGEVATRTFTVLWSGLESGRLCYLMEFLGEARSYPQPPVPDFIDSITPRGIGAVSDSVRICFSEDVSSVTDIAIVSDPEMLFGSPIFSQDSTCVVFAPLNEWESYTDYTLSITVDLVWEGYWPSDTFTHEFRTSDSIFENETVAQVCSVSGDTLYRFLRPSVTVFDFADRDSCEVLLQGPLVVGQAWLAYTTSGEGTHYLARIASIGELEVAGQEYQDVIEVSCAPGGRGVRGRRSFAAGGRNDTTRYWFAPGTGIVKFDSGSVVGRLTSHQP